MNPITSNAQSPATPRLPYESPTLVDYGTVTELTLAGTSSQPEGARPLPGKRP